MDTEKPTQINEAMRSALARMYSDKDMRDYLQNAMRIANAKLLLLLQMNKVDEAKVQATVYDTMKQLLEKGKENFVHFDKIKQNGNSKIQ